MLAFVMASMMVAASDPAPHQAAAPLTNQPTRFCREIGSAASRSQAILICRTKAQWQRIESCNGATRYCPPRSQAGALGRQTAFALNEDSRITCRSLAVTGSRLKSAPVCLPQREWERMWKDSAAGVLKLQDQSTRVEAPPQ